MEVKEDFQMFPWSTQDEFRSVANIILNLNLGSNLLYNIDFLKDLQWIERQLTIWRTKTNSALHSYEIDATHAIVNCLIHEYLPKLNKIDQQARSTENQLSIEQTENTNLTKSILNNDERLNNLTNGSKDDLNDSQNISDLNDQLTDDQLEKEEQSKNLNSINLPFDKSFNLINEETIAVLYSNAILKFFKMLSFYDIIDDQIERLLSRSEANLVRICKRLDFPQYIIEYRHRIAHNKMPSFEQLKIATQIALNWIKKNYWSKYLTLLDNQEKSKIQIYEQTTMILTNLFEENTDDQFNKATTDRRPPKKQKIDLKRFNVLDRKHLSLLNDTLYDLLIEDFYSTLHAITLYIVRSTKDHLDEITVDVMRKWIEDDGNNMSSILNSKNQQEAKNQLKEKRRKDQLIPNFILKSFIPIFEIITKQLSSINQLLFYLHSILQDQNLDLKTSAQVWFIQIICSLINNLNYSELSPIDKLKLGNPLTEFEKCLRLSEVQLMDLKWNHLFTILVEEPIMDKLNLCLVKRFYPLISFKYSKVKFNQICDLLSIYLDANESTENDGRKKKQSVQQTNSDEHNYFDLNQMDTLPSSNQFTNDIDWSKVKLGFI